MAAAYNVTAIQVTGWNLGGQDQANPWHVTDPRLGTHEQFKDAIASTQQLGVKVILFTKFLWADQTTQWYKDELHSLAVKDPWGDAYRGPAYQYSTVTQWLDINTKRLVPMCWSSSDYQAIIEAQFANELALEPDGILQDECQHHSADLCFDTSHGHRYGSPAYREDRNMIHKLAAKAKAALPTTDFLFAGESPYDAEFDAYHLGYLRSASPGHQPLKRYTLPSRPIVTAIIGFNDRSMLNQCLLFRYSPSFEPLDFHGWLDTMPGTMAYGAHVIAMQKEAREWVWDGELRLQAGAEVSASNDHELVYSTYISADKSKAGSCAVVIANYEPSYGSPNFDPKKSYNGATGLNATVTPIAECAGGDLDKGGKWRHADEPGSWHPWHGPGGRFVLARFLTEDFPN